MPVISEICQNHLGDMNCLRQMVYVSAECGAQAAKIQSFFSDDLGINWDGDKDRMRALELSWNDQAQFVKWCEEANLIAITSVYTTRYIQDVWNAGFRYIKIGSAQARDELLIKTYMTAGFKVIVSTGGHILSKIPRFAPLSGVLHCVSKYPSIPEEADLLRMLEIKKWFFNTPYGFSDHTDPMHAQWDMPLKMAIYMGATWIEKHFTIRPRNETRDGPVSITSVQLTEVCRWDKLSQEQRLLENPSLGILASPKDIHEKDLISRYEGRWKK